MVASTVPSNLLVTAHEKVTSFSKLWAAGVDREHARKFPIKGTMATLAIPCTVDKPCKIASLVLLGGHMTVQYQGEQAGEKDQEQVEDLAGAMEEKQKELEGEEDIDMVKEEDGHAAVAHVVL